MAPKIHPIFSQELDNGETGEFAIGDDGKAYWNGKPIVTEEKVVLQLWVNIALIVTALAVVGQMIFAGLAYLDSHKATQKSFVPTGVSATEQPGLFPLLAEYPCDKEGKMFYTTEAGVLACVDGELKPSASCDKDGQSISANDNEVRLVCRTGKWTPPGVIKE